MTTFKQQEIDKFKNKMKSIESEYGCKILLAFVRGSHMYGTSTDKSDVDITFVYQQPTSDILRGDYKEQITVGGNDIVGYEIQRFITLLGQNNPNILEALDIPEDCLIHKDELMDPILQQHLWLSKLTEKTILGYADSQIKKATGLKKKMNNPMVEKKDILDFCYIIYDGKSSPVRKEFSEEELSRAGLVNIPNSRGIYGLYIDEQKNQNFRGILKDENSTQLRLSSIPKDFAEIYHCYTMYYNQDGYEVWKKEYESYQKWLIERNEERHNTNSEHGKNYDCYLDSETEYLTNRGWLKYDDIKDTDLIASVNNDRELIYLPILDRVKSKYIGNIYKYEDRYTKFSVTPNHNLYQSKLNRTAYDDSYKEDRSDWKLKTVEDYLNQLGISNYLSHLSNSCTGIENVPLEWFFILGAYIGDGGMTIKEKTKILHISQNENKPLFGKLKELTDKVYFSRETKLGKNFRFDFTDKDLVEWVLKCAGVGTFGKKLDIDLLNMMSPSQFDYFYYGIINSDGTTNKNGDSTYYSSNKTLIDNLQLMFFSRGIYCQIYEYPSDSSGFNPSVDTQYHLFIPKNNKKEYKQLLKKNFEKVFIEDYISCFTVSTGVIITRNSNKIAVQGNSKNMMHLFRLLNMAFIISMGGKLTVREDDVEWLMEIRRGEIEHDELIEYSDMLFNLIKSNFSNLELQDSPDKEIAKQLILAIRQRDI